MYNAGIRRGEQNASTDTRLYVTVPDRYVGHNGTGRSVQVGLSGSGKRAFGQRNAGHRVK